MAIEQKELQLQGMAGGKIVEIHATCDTAMIAEH